MPLTGRFEFRRSRMGKVVLQVEDEEARGTWFRSQKAAHRRRWRDAKVMDLAAPELRPLIDLRRYPRPLIPSAQLSAPSNQSDFPGAERHLSPSQTTSSPGSPLDPGSA
jgi:hypothetical protein